MGDYLDYLGAARQAQQSALGAFNGAIWGGSQQANQHSVDLSMNLARYLENAQNPKKPVYSCSFLESLRQEISEWHGDVLRS